MKANRFCSIHGAFLVLITCLLTSSFVQAQTFSGRRSLTELPDQLEAVVFPLTNLPSTIKVSFNNRTGGTVRVIIRNENGKVFYDEHESIALYRRRFDLSPLPEGNYIVELTKMNSRFMQAFAIQSPTASHIAMEVPPILILPDKPADKKLAVSQQNQN